MYRKKTSSWLKHWDFILLDLILLEVSYLLAQWLRHGTAYYREAPLYRNVFFTIAAIDLVVGLMMGSYRGILEEGTGWGLRQSQSTRSSWDNQSF